MENNYTVELTNGFSAGVTGISMSEDTPKQERLKKEEWTALYYDQKNALVLYTYASYERPTKRHGWKRTAAWGFIDRRNNTIESAPKIPMSLGGMMLEKFRSSIVLLEKKE